MRKFRLSAEAKRDLREIWTYIADDSVKAARSFRLHLLDACQTIAENPELGHVRDDVTTKPVKFWPSGSYLIVYDPKRKPLTIARIVHGARDLPNIL